MLRIDAHQHFWRYDPARDCWITDNMAAIKRDFLPEHLLPVLHSCGMDGCVAIQSNQTEAENHFQLMNAGEHPFIKGIVGWVNLCADNVHERLAYYSQFEKIKGYRHVLQGEPQRDFMLRPDFMNGIAQLKKYGYTYDILIFSDQLAYIDEFVRAFPDQPFVIDHIAKPDIKNNRIDEWRAGIRTIAGYANVFCKISGMVTETDWNNWKKVDFNTYMHVIAENFGIDRVMFGSDWPVCNLAAGYDQVLDIAEDFFAGFSKFEQEKVFGLNAVKFYNLS